MQCRLNLLRSRTYSGGANHFPAFTAVWIVPCKPLYENPVYKSWCALLFVWQSFVCMAIIRHPTLNGGFDGRFCRS